MPLRQRMKRYAVPYLVAMLVAALLGFAHAPYWTPFAATPFIVWFGLWWTFLRGNSA